MRMQEMTLSTFGEALASKAAVPGGGGASALAGALGAALGAMVGELTLGKPKYAAVQDQIAVLTAEARKLSSRLLALTDEDAEAFLPLRRAYAIPREDPRRGEELERCLRLAAAPPMEMVRQCCRAIELMEHFATLGSVLAISDAAVGAVLCRGALYGAAMNVKVNTAAMTDRTYAQQLNDEVDQLTAAYGARAEKVFADVYGRYC